MKTGRLQVGFIGLGRISDLHILGYQDSNEADICAVCDPNTETLHSKANQWCVQNRYQHYQDLLLDDTIDAVEILTPQFLHEEMVIAAAKAGKHISCQKPLSIDYDSAERMVSCCREHDVILKLSENYLYYPPVVLAKKMIDDGLIGTVTNIRIKMVAGSNGGWPVPESAWKWRAKEAQAGRGTQTFDHGHHLWAVAWFLLGRIEKVKSWIDIDEEGIDSPASIMWKHVDAHKYGQCEYVYAKDLHIPSDYYSNDEWFEISGSAGIIKINRCNGRMIDSPPVSVFTNSGWKDYDVPSDWKWGFYHSTKNFIRGLHGKEPIFPNALEALELLDIDLAISQSAKADKTVMCRYVQDIPAARQQQNLPPSFSRVS